MIKDLNPLHLIPEYSVEIQYNNSITDVAHVEKKKLEDKREHYIIRMNKVLAAEMFANSLLFGKIPFDYFLAGLLYHEVAHIKEKSFSVEMPIQTAFYHYIANVLLDAQIEYQFSKDFPESALYIRYALICLRRDCNMKMLEKIKGGDKTIKRRETFYRLVRFGTILSDSDEEFVNFLLPLVLSVQRNEDVKNVFLAATAIYEYIYEASESEDIKSAITKLVSDSKRVPMNEKDLKDLEDASGQISGEQVLVSNLKDLLDDLKDQKIQKIQIGQQAGIGGSVEIEEKSDAFYRQTIEKHRDKIAYIRNAFKRKLNEIIRISAFDGELNVTRQQEAYINSFTGDETEIYTVQKLKKISLDHLVIRDISSSTFSFMTEYAEACVILHAAIQNLGIRDGHIDFNYNHAVLLRFDEQLKFARIHPRASGGTAIQSSYQEALKMSWKGKKKMITVVTDGYIEGSYEKEEQQLKAKGIIIDKYHIGMSNDKDVIQTTIDRFHFDIAKRILRQL